MRCLGGLALAALLGVAGAEAFQHEGLTAVRQRGYLRVCADPSNPPYSSSDHATPGFEVELARLVARELGVDARMEWKLTHVGALKPLRDGACELFMGLPHEARFREGNPWIAVSRPYYVMIHGLVTKADAPTPGLADLGDRRVAVQRQSIAEFYLGHERPTITRGLYRTQEEAFGAVADGAAAAALLWYPVAAWLARGRAELRVIPVSGDILEFPIGAGVRKRDPGLAEAIDAAIGRLLDSGQAQQLLERYGAVPYRGSQRRDDIVLAGTDDPIEIGRSLFSTACSRCHGAEGVGGGAGGNLPRIRNYDGGLKKFMRILMDGRKGSAMAGFKGILTEAEGRSIYEYLTSLPRQ